ncbi:MAG: ABC transporter substrate-binding protein [Rhizobiaceae bacterium]|nr:ABC transporter substrate-binding protein [Rhizobiaceae bacterium]
MNKTITSAIAILVAGFATSAFAQDQTVKIGVLADISGAYANLGGMGSVESARMAVEDFGGTAAGMPVEVIFADGQNKPDVAAGIARQWYDDGVDMIAELPLSSIALAVMEVAKEREKVVMVTSAISSQITGESCTPYSVHWTSDTYAMAAAGAKAAVDRGAKKWFFIAPDYSLGTAAIADATTIVEANGGSVVGSVKHPFNNMDFSSYLLQAQSSGADVIGIASGGNDLVNAIKQAREFGIGSDGMAIAALVASITDVHAIGIQDAAGMTLAEPVYWDQNDETREFAARFEEKVGSKPSQSQAGIYGAVLHYLKAVDAAGTDDADAVMEKMREIPINDFMTNGGSLRIDGRVMRPMYAFEVKSADQSGSEWDLYNEIGTIPADQAVRPLSEGGCPLAN